MFIDYLNSPTGIIEIKASEQGITNVNFVESRSDNINPNTHTTACKQQLEEYFAGELREFDLPLDAQGTEFQRQVWQQLQNIPFGASCSYQELADKLQNPKAVRAVGAANGKNPVAVIVPCHRVIGSNGTLTGYAGGLERKAWLLKHEGITLL
ncbi:MAG: methylated-DNA--[protein]-cysteine S-methyltransferase [Thiolinea sp.]